MLRSPSVTSQYRDDLSSPDPLATSPNDEHNIGNSACGSRKPAPQRPSTATTKNIAKHTRSSSHGNEAFPSSPFCTVSEQHLSPWKIRVTVEAEPENADMEGNSPMTRARTRTTKISLQSDRSPTKDAKSSARARKSHASTKRGATPERTGRSSSRSRRQSVTDLDIIPLGDDSERDDWLKQKKSPRKRRSPRKSTTAADDGPQPSSSKSKSNIEEPDDRPDTGIEGGDATGEPGPARGSEAPIPAKLHLHQMAVRPRGVSTSSNKTEGCTGQDSIPYEKIRISTHQAQLQARKVSVNSAMSYPTPSPTSSYHGDSDEVLDSVEDEPAANHGSEGFDTMLESEGFTMIDLETLPSVRRYLSSPSEEAAAAKSGPAQMPSLITEGPSAVPTKNDITGSLSPIPEQTVAYPTLRVDESDISSTVPSSPPTSEQNAGLLKVSSSSRPGLMRKVTPQPYSPPKHSSPPKHQPRRTPQHQHRASAGALFAGIALQEIMSPGASTEKELPQENALTSQPPNSHGQDALFNGFDSGTQRELRAGLRFGEELAKRQVGDLPAQSVATVTREKAGTELDRSSTQGKVQSRINDKSTWTHQEPLAPGSKTNTSPGLNNTQVMEKAPRTPQNRASEPSEPDILDTQARRKRDWQLEREAVSRQIQEASESQVIVINSDSEDEEPSPKTLEKAASHTQLDDEAGDETDIWLAEAKSSSSPPRGGTNDLFTRTEQRQQQERAREAVNRPRRSLIPSPWKRGEDVEVPNEQGTFLSTNMDEASGLMAYKGPENGVRFGAGQIQRQQLRQRSNSGKFDIDLMTGTPKKDAVEEESVDVSRDQDVDEDDHGAQPRDYPGDRDQEESSVSISHEEQYENDDSTKETLNLSEVTSSPPQPVKIPVNFNDSSISLSTPQPPRQTSATQRPFLDAHEAESPPRPPTPRSAMKGSRESMAFPRPDTPTMIRRVIFSGRSRGVDVDGQESSFSMRSSSDDTSFGDEVGRQLRQELQAAEIAPAQSHPLRRDIEIGDERPQVAASRESPPQKETPATELGKVWGSWIWGSKQKPDNVSQPEGQRKTDHAPKPKSKSTPTSTTATTLKDPATQQHHQEPEPERQKTKSSIPASAKPTHRVSNIDATYLPLPLPSYLLPPSYPSDPLRSTSTPLATAGDFTNAHFRTLHIIYRKSLRPKFHPPPRDQIRDEVWALRGKQMIVDETRNGLVKGEFVWTVGDGEVEVLERYMQECEFSMGWFRGRKVREGPTTVPKVMWGWTAEELCERLCRIVVGEVVREEESKVKKEKGRGP
ncbi:hypothetical protein A1O7_07548 [Cladophialophora yegresii CBS 114405]|uniref:Uncharacterized protein n=1 Tax=Cladophialophora yegresii CBS 114405 TaxID=1182544 RepID=W9VY81_9EURO|nr:uncharacterized protein A1O7_07548 [Cladophialophora yegresii CBS 114405]EXJ57201.1 hypothetical protein A1O7_07548 [Cladophialophora yegresii CBS 114405]